LTYSQVREQIRQQLDQRTDLDNIIDQYAQRRIQYWSAYFFYSADVTDTSITTAVGQPFYDLPNGMRSIRAMRLLLPGSSNSYTVTTSVLTLPTGTIPVSTTTGFTTTGTINVGGQIVSYTGITPTSFTGAAGGAGLIIQGAGVTQIAPSTATTADVTLPASVIDVVSTAGFLPSGVINLGGTQVSYRSLTATSFNGCIGGIGTVLAGSLVQQITGIWITLDKMDYKEMLERDVVSPNIQGLPDSFAQFNLQFRLYLVPDQSYQLELTGSAAPPAPINDDDTNWWTEDGAQLTIFATAAEVKQFYLHEDGSAERAGEVREYRRIMKTTINVGDPLRFRSHL
jgi:hypothetical protein